ncbi:hypothetical protein F511_36792 [Dorcoceras hygrometricum]|uniref:Uncharacterized protein n=1 Tax=Dorcoceras hygrometricum TaxID=472368 RepID=A0A2Z7BY27_9LAMI|nr:hypothetical protein F511_36792 [Dorcoceras hygrometricum]
MKASGESSTTKHRLLHASAPHSIPPPDDRNRVDKRVKVRNLSCRVSMTFRVVRANLYNQDLGLIHSTNGNHLESSNEGSSIDHQVTIHLHAQNITMFPTNETWYFTLHILVSSSGGLILILTAQLTRNEFLIHRSRTSILPPPMLKKLSLIFMRESRNQYLCDPQWFRDTASREPTTCATPKPHFQTSPSNHGKAPSNIAP